jgi:hypothetical protein
VNPRPLTRAPPGVVPPSERYGPLPPVCIPLSSQTLIDPTTRSTRRAPLYSRAARGDPRARSKYRAPQDPGVRPRQLSEPAPPSRAFRQRRSPLRSPHHPAPVHPPSLLIALCRFGRRGRRVQTIDVGRRMSVPPASLPLPMRKLVPGIQTLAARPIPHLVPEIHLPPHSHQSLLSKSFVILSIIFMDNTHMLSPLGPPRQGPPLLFWEAEFGCRGSQALASRWRVGYIFTNLVD